MMTYRQNVLVPSLAANSVEPNPFLSQASIEVLSRNPLVLGTVFQGV